VVRAFAKTGRPLKTTKQLNIAAEVIPVTCPEELELMATVSFTATTVCLHTCRLCGLFPFAIGE